MEIDDLKRFVKIPTLKSERVILRRITHKDLDDVFEYANDPHVSEFLLWYPHDTRGYTRRYLSLIDSKYRKAQFYDWGIEFEGKMIGTCGFTSFSVENNSAEVGFVLNQKYWGRGIAKEACLLVMRYGFDVLKLNRIESKYMIENLGSKRVMEKCNMTFDGVLRQAIYSKGKYRDVGVYSILKDEFYR